MSYKRNQIEEAIARVVVPNCKEPPSELRTRIKRLLELDHSEGRKVRSKYAEHANFAFRAEAPGTGVDILFSEYEAFALLNGLRMMDHGWPQCVKFAIVLSNRGIPAGRLGQGTRPPKSSNSWRKDKPRSSFRES
jgi:hypothetical protein